MVPNTNIPPSLNTVDLVSDGVALWQKMEYNKIWLSYMGGLQPARCSPSCHSLLCLFPVAVKHLIPS